jgi:hypothetical protein
VGTCPYTHKIHSNSTYKLSRLRPEIEPAWLAGPVLFLLSMRSARLELGDKMLSSRADWEIKSHWRHTLHCTKSSLLPCFASTLLSLLNTNRSNGLKSSLMRVVRVYKWMGIGKLGVTTIKFAPAGRGEEFKSTTICY